MKKLSKTKILRILLVLSELALFSFLYINDFIFTAIWVLMAVEFFIPPGIISVLFLPFIVKNTYDPKYNDFQKGFDSGVKNGLKLGFGISLRTLRDLQKEFYKSLENDINVTDHSELRKKYIFETLDSCIDLISDFSRKQIEYIEKQILDNRKVKK